MIDLIRKRHEGEGWAVFSELANGTGYKCKGWADAAALGIWPSRGYELHGYEFKASREDLKKELRDPGKADNVGRYCHYWWLVVTEEKLMDGLIIPDAWGILVPKAQVLRAVRKAPKVADPKPFDPGFVAAMIRNVTKTWVPKREHELFREQAHQKALAEIEVNSKRESDSDARELAQLRATIEAFERRSGLRLNNYNGGQIGDQVALLESVRHQIGTTGLETQIRALDRVTDEHRRLASGSENAAAVLRSLVPAIGFTP